MSIQNDQGAQFPTPRFVCPDGDRPSFSPGGERIVYHVQPANSSDVSLWMVNSDGSGAHLLYPPPGTANPRASRPDWSWSERIAFANNGEIWTILPDGTDAQPYYGGGRTVVDGKQVSMSYPSWQRDLQAVIAVGYWEGLHNAALFRITPDSVEQLTTSPHPCAGRPSVSPDATRIAFAGSAGQCQQVQNQIWVAEPPAAPYRLEPGNPAAFQGRSPNWSPNGDLIVFESTRPAPDPARAPLAVWVMGSDGSSPRRLTEGGVHPEWNRQQTQIVYATAAGLYIIDYPSAYGS